MTLTRQRLCRKDFVKLNQILKVLYFREPGEINLPVQNNDRNIKKGSEILSKLTIKTPEWRHR